MAWASFYYTGFFGWLAIVGQGIGLSFLFCAMHECSHGTAFRTTILNKLISSFVGLLLFIGPRWFQYFHAAHHRHTQDPALDPELAISKPKTWGQYLFHLTGIMIWTSNLRALLFNAIRTPKHSFIPPSSQYRIKTEARLMLLTYTFIFTGAVILAPQYILQFWLLPLLLGQPFLRLFLLAEHAGCPHEPDMLKNSRTTRTNPLVLFLSWNMPYHTAHHSFPAVPFHQLPSFISISQNTQQLQQMDILLFIASTRSAFLMKKFRLDKISLINAPMLHKNRVQNAGLTKRSRFALVNITRKF